MYPNAAIKIDEVSIALSKIKIIPLLSSQIEASLLTGVLYAECLRKF